MRSLEIARRAIGKMMSAKCLPLALIPLLGGCEPAVWEGTDAPFPEIVDAAPMAADPDIDLSNYDMTFEEQFHGRLDVSAWDCDTQWIAHTPWNGDFGAARFADPVPGFPFRTKHGMLRIEAANKAGWKSGLLSGWNTCGEGFAQQFGYFEMRAQLPPGDGFWPAFWLIGVDRSRFTAEVDVIEHHGAKPAQFTHTIHVHPRAEGVNRVLLGHIQPIDEGLLYRGFNTFGVSIEDDDIVFYLNRKETWRTPTSDHFKQPVFMLLNLAMEQSEITDATPSPAFMYVDYVRAYQRKPVE